jgi:hypothetical protein
MQNNNDTVPMGLAMAIFGVLGLLIVAAFLFAGWSLLQWRSNAGGTVINLGKNIETIAPAFAEAEEMENGYFAEAEQNGIMLEAHGEMVLLGETPPMSIEYTTFVPLDGIFEAMGYRVSWDEEDGVAIFTDGANTVIVTMDEGTFMANGEIHSLTTPARLVNDVPMFPLRPVAESLGYTVTFNEITNAISVFYSPEEPAPEVEPEPELVQVTCGTCHGTGSVTCSSCNGIGGGRGTPFIAGIPYELAPAADVWWCSACGGEGTVPCGTCAGAGSIIVPIITPPEPENE